MNYSLNILGKDLHNLEYDDVRNYFQDPREESDLIEYKSFVKDQGGYKDKLKGLKRAICALLNSYGGILIWGAPTKITIEEKEIYQGSLRPIPKFYDKDKLVNIISDGIIPMPIGIRVQILSESEMYIYVIEVSKSEYDPHRFQNDYYVRLDGQTRIAPHYLLEAMFKKIRFPNLEGYINLDNYEIKGNNLKIKISSIIFNFSPIQNAQNTYYQIYTPHGKLLQKITDFAAQNWTYSPDGHTVKVNIDLLVKGNPLLDQHVIIVDYNRFRKEYNSKIHLELHFASKSAPMKISSYEIEISAGTYSQNDIPRFLKIKEENILQHDKEELLGSNRKDILAKMLKR